MEIFMSNIAFTATKNQIKSEVANIIHGPDYARHSTGLPLNLEVYIIPARQNNRGGRRPGGQGKLTLPSAELGRHFLDDYSGPRPRRRLRIGTEIRFVLSNKPPRPDTLEYIRGHPYIDPTAEEDQEALSRELQSHTVHIDTLSFGWECRDNVFSIEWERVCGGQGMMTFDHDQREFRIQVPDPSGADDAHVVAIRASQIAWASTGHDGVPVIYITMVYAPSFQSSKAPNDLYGLIDLMRSLGVNRRSNDPPPRSRHTALDETHSDVVAYSSNAMRLVCRQAADLQSFRALCRAVHIRVDDFIYPAVRRSLFSTDVRRRYTNWTSQLAWPVAFQLEALTRNMLFDFQEIMRLRDRIDRMAEDRGFVYTAAFLRYLGVQAKGWFWFEDDSRERAEGQTDSAEEFLARCIHDFAPPAPRIQPLSTDNFQCLHVIVTPTTIRLEGPYPERSNRVIRHFPRDTDSFMRVSFVDENNLQYRMSRDVDGKTFIKEWVGRTLHNGLDIAGRHFEFLAYSQSALKEHAVWFVKPFRGSDGIVVNAASIISGLGTFDRVRSDPRLIYCPARYGARISQAFTATDASITIDPEDILTIDDIKDPDGHWVFTDGVGTISRDLAREVWRELTRSQRRRNRRRCPPAFQIRFMGSKGMVSIDYELTGRVICLRPSMIKFEAPNSREIEVARAFDKPGPFSLNRPLIMVLEGLGVPYETFETLQKNAVTNAQGSVESLARAAKLLEAYGLGQSYQLTSVLLSLDKLGLGPLFWDPFWLQMMKFAIHHVLRELKHHARIPVPDAWNLVGIADIHEYLEEGEIFVHISTKEGNSFYLEGPTMVSRSPCIHPGDVQMARAIGSPPMDSPFVHESFRNCIVFSVKGNRPLPSCLGGGDLDGDLFGCTTVPAILPRRIDPPAEYATAQRMELNRPSTMADVADFVTQYIYSDNLGIIASKWLTIADQSDLGIRDPACMILSKLHSDAVDYPKSGRPVSLDQIPRTRFRQLPDYVAPETKETANTADYYESQHHIGKLYRMITLPALPEVQRAQNAQRRLLRSERTVTVEEVLAAFEADHEDDEEDPNLVREAVETHVLNYISLGRHDDVLVSEVWDLFSSYRSELQTICAENTVSRDRSAMLTEEEAVVGTIVAKCPQPRMRRDKISKLREQTNTLVQSVGHQLEGEIGILPEKSLERAWVAYRISLLTDNEYFGAKSFGWIALREIFDAIKAIEAENEGFF